MRDVFVRSVNEEYDELLRCYVGQRYLLWGEVDTTVPVEVARRIYDTAPELTRMEIVPGAGHLLPLERPKHFADAVSAVIGLGGER
jgi:hypothetical protein